MPLDVLGRTRATLTEPTSSSPCPKGLGNLVKLCRAGDRALQLLLFNEECLVSASHQLALITSLPFLTLLSILKCTRGSEIIKEAHGPLVMPFNCMKNKSRERLFTCIHGFLSETVAHRLCGGKIKRFGTS